MDSYLSAITQTTASGSRSDSGIEGSSLGSGSTSLTINHMSTLETASTIDASDAQSQDDIPFDGADDCHSAASLDDDWYRVDTAAGGAAGVTAVAPKHNEIDAIDERDRFSPVDFPAELPPSVNDDNAEDNNRLFRRSSNDRGRLSSKEEKQRQNEELVILESSSVSSETGSWESVFPQRQPSELKDTCISFLSQEQRFSAQGTSQDEATAASAPVVDTPIPNAQSMDVTSTPAKSAHSMGACFIDASSLLDDEDVYPTSYTPQPVLPAVACRGPQPLSPHSEKSNHSPEEDSDKGVWPKPSHLDPLESFHMEFDMCKMAKSQPDSAIDLTNDDDQPDGSRTDRIINLSDEQKLNKRDKEQIVVYEIKDQYSSDSVARDGPAMANAMVAGQQRRRSDDRMRSSGGNDMAPHDQERKQGTLLFQNSIQQYSTHVMNPQANAYAEENNYSDLSLPSVYSGSSEHGNDCTSAFETSSQYSSNCGDTMDYGSGAHEATRFTKGVVSETEAVLYPDTPHNSIIHVDAGRHVRRDDSGMVSASPTPETHSDNGLPSRRLLKGIDAAPIVSGGVSTLDFVPKQCGSPMTQRRTETCPIVSGGSIADDYDTKPESKYVERPRLSAAVNSWVVDMSDCNNKSRRRQSDSSSSSIDTAGRSVDAVFERSGSASSHKGLGFYVSLNDMKPPRLSNEVLSKSLNYRPATSGNERKRSTGFYIDFSESECSQTATPPPSKNTQTPPVNSNANDKKNMFSMFIDFGAENKTVKRHQSEDLSASLPTRHNDLSSLESNASAAVPAEKSPKGHYMYIEGEAPVALRRPQTVNIASVAANRHSWSTAKEQSPQPLPRDHKRSVSVHSGEHEGIMHILDKIPLISKASNASIADTPTADDSISSCSNSLTSGTSVHSNLGGNMPDVMSQSARRRQRDAKINETFDKSSQGSLTDGILSKHSSPTTDTEDLTFQNEIEEAVLSGVMATIAEAKETASPKKAPIPAERTTINNRQADKPHTMESLQATIEKQKQLLDTVTEEAPVSSFVKLSDMDKPVQHFELHTETMSKSMGSNRIGKLFDGSRAGSRNSWHNMSRSTGNNLTNLASSADNLRSLSRIFPHLSKDISTSSPAEIEQDFFSKSPIEMELMQSDFSITSSATSSFSRSGIDSADELSMSCRQPKRLGEDLLKMFLQEIATDVVIEVNGRRMRAHKCILRSRCQYFAAILAGGWVQSAGNVISLSGYSYGSVHFALCHIYSGASHPPDGISLMELAALADLLGLEGLKEVTGHALRTNYCHNFHKPCSGCIEGIMQVFPVALNQGLDDLYRKCLRWACKHYIKVWPARAFSQLPPDLIVRCRQHIIAHMTSETVLNILLDCDHLIALLASCRWAGNVEDTVRDIIDAGHAYISDHFSNLVASDGFLSLGHGQSWNINRLEDILLRTAATLTPDQACRSYQRVTRLNSVLGAKVIRMPATAADNGYNDQYEIEHEEEMDWNPEFIRLISALLSAVEQCLIRQCSRAMKTPQWPRMDTELRKKIQKLACLTEPAVSRPRANQKPVTYSPVASHNSRTQDLYQVKLAIQAHSKRSQEGHSYRPTTNNAHDRHAPNERHYQPTHTEVRATERNGTGNITKSSSKAQVPDLISTIKPKTPLPVRHSTLSAAHRRSQSETNNKTQTKEKRTQSEATTNDKPRVAEVKPRYLEPKRARAPAALKNQTNLPLRQRNISSSDSSRETSPVGPTVRRNKDSAVPVVKKVPAIESITMSRDSLASPAKQNRLTKAASGVSCNDYENSVDSLCDSLRSSVKTDDTKSQESLVHLEAQKSKEAIASKANQKVNKENVLILTPTVNHSIAGRKAPATKKLTATNKNLSTCQTNSTNSSPASVTNARRLSSTSSVSSPRDGPPKLRHSFTPSVPARKSFLSARSKEILARKEAALKQSESAKCVPSAIREKVNGSVNKSSSTSNMLNRRPNSTTVATTTLHLRRTARLSSTTSVASNASTASYNSLMNPTKSSSMKMVAQNNKVNKEKIAKKVTKATSVPTAITKSTKNERDLYDDGDDLETDIIIRPSGRVESKLERSSTFCKEVSDLPAGELQVID